MKYAELLLDEIKSEYGYTHCFFVAGGASMHLLDAARTRFHCIPVVHEVAAGIAAEYFNESNVRNEKAFALITSGPGVTNIATAVAGAYLESRELLILAGQVKTSDLKTGKLRQRGIQEIDGKELFRPISNYAITLISPRDPNFLKKYLGVEGRKGPVFIEIPLDVQGTPVLESEYNDEESVFHSKSNEPLIDDFASKLRNELMIAKRPIVLLGGGFSRRKSREIKEKLECLGIPIMTTWNGADRYGSDLKNSWGRPNTWGQRSANILIQQADLLIAVGTRLGIQQTGFAWEDFSPLAKIFQIDIDNNELEKGHPRIFAGVAFDADMFMDIFLRMCDETNYDFQEWLDFGSRVIEYFPLNEIENKSGFQYVNPYEFIEVLSMELSSDDNVIPCSSGGAFTVSLQALKNRFGQVIISNKGLASMGYGLSGAIGASISNQRRTILIEGDGGFAQNLQELGTVFQQKLNLKMFIFENQGYASIRMTQKNYFDGAYLGCDVETGLGLPNWNLIAQAYGISSSTLSGEVDWRDMLHKILQSDKPEFVIVKIDPDQNYWPKIASRVLPDGNMRSNPLHLMSPDLSEDEKITFLPYLNVYTDRDKGN
jgi:acetolactate synthase-1/2/3 large subunit